MFNNMLPAQHSLA